MSYTPQSNGSSPTGHANAQPPAADEGRDARGRFTKGNKGGPGNPFARKVAALRRAMVNFVSEDDLKHIVFVIKMRAEGGDMAAAKLLLQYVIGKPTETVDPDRVDIDEWEKLQEQARPAQEMSAIMDGVPAHLACTMAKIAWPCRTAKQFSGPMLEGIKAMDARDAEQAASAKQQAEERGAGSGDPRPTPVGDPRPAREQRRAAKLAARKAARRKRKQHGSAPAPMANGGNVPWEETWPSPYGGNGDLDAGDWLQALVRAALAEGQGGSGAERP